MTRSLPNGTHSTRFFNSFAANLPSRLCIINGQTHFFVQNNPAVQPGSSIQIATIKRVANGDTRYNQFLGRPTGCGTFQTKGPL